MIPNQQMIGDILKESAETVLSSEGRVQLGHKTAELSYDCLTFAANC